MMERYETLEIPEVNGINLFAKVIVEKFKEELLEIKSKKSDSTIVIEFNTEKCGNHYQINWEGEIIK